MSRFKLKTEDLTKIIFDTEKYVNSIKLNEDILNIWLNIKQLYDTLEYIISRKDDIILTSDLNIFNKLIIIKKELETSISNIQNTSDKKNKISELNILYDTEKAKEKENQNAKLKRAIENFWCPHYESQTKTINFTNFYYDSEGYYIQIDENGVMERKDIRLADINSKSR